MNNWNTALAHNGKIVNKVEMVVVTHGHWLLSNAYPNILFCSECNEPFKKDNADSWDYCPHCGAKMDEKKDDDDTVYMMGDEHCVFKYSKGERKENAKTD